MNVEIRIPSDEDGFVLLKCHLCGEIFKLKPSDYRDDSIFEIYCPSCGLTSGLTVDSYITDDVVALGSATVQNHINEFNKLGKNSGFFKTTTKMNRKSEKRIMLTIDSLEIKKYKYCKLNAKIKPILSTSISYCLYCGGVYHGTE